MTQERLTNQPSISYAKERGKFMPDGGNRELGKTEKPDISQAQEGTSEPTRPNRVTPKEARARWESLYLKGRDINTLPPEERRTILSAIEEGISPKGGGAENIDTTGIIRVELRRIADEINNEATRLGTQREFSPDYLESQRRRVQDLIDRGTFTEEAEIQQAQGLINTLNQRLDVASREVIRGRRGEGVHLYVGSSESQRLNPDDYQSTEVKEVVRRIKADIEIEREREKVVDNDYLRDEIDNLLTLQRQLETAEAMEAADEITRLRGRLHELKEFLNAQETRENIERGPQTLYGEIRLTEKQKEELVHLAIEGNIEEVERRFNQLFATADTRSGDDWREAGGTVQQLEVDDFTRRLDQIAAGRVAYRDKQGRDRRITDEEKRSLERIARMLAQEMKLRALLHNITYYANKDFGIEDLRRLTKEISAADVDFAFRINGVVKVSHYFEQAMLQVMAKNGGYLPAEAMYNKPGGEFGEVEVLVRKQIEIDRNLGTLDLKDWEINRAVSMARGMNIVTLRSFSIIAEHGIPPAAGAALVSWWANNIIKRLAFFRQIARFNVGIERNRFLNMRLEKGGRFWRAEELTGGRKGGYIQEGGYLERFINETYDDRLIDQINPAQVGDIFTQTQWRWVQESDYHAAALTHLLDGYRYNPIIGAGMWLEKARRMFGLEENDKLSGDEIKDAKDQLGKDVRTKGELAKALIDRNLDLAAAITPLKLFYNMTGLRQRVLRNHYRGSFREEREGSGKIFVKDETLEKDLETLAVIQEGLLRKRADAYKNYLQSGKQGPKPDLYREHTDLDAYIRELAAEGKLKQEQADRILTFVGYVRAEFVKPNQKDRLIANLKDKGWKIPFIFGTDDLPYDLYDFSKTGNSLDRRWGDNESVAQSAEVFTKKLLEKMSEFRDQDTLIAVMKEIYDTMKGHDESRTRDFMLFLGEAIIKYFKKDITGRLPFGIGMAKGVAERLKGGGTSAAQILNGPMQMAWDEIDVYTFILKMHEAQIIRKEDIKNLRKRAGAENWNLMFAVGRTAVPLGIFAFIYYLLAAELKEAKLAA